MKLEDVKAFIDENKDNEEVQAYLQGFKNPLTVEGVQEFILQNDDAKKWLDSEKDKHFNKAFETWKTNNWEKELDAEIRKRFPEKDEKDIQLEQMRVELEQIKRDAQRKELMNQALLVADEKKLPKDIVKYFIGKDEEETTKNLETLENVFSSHVETMVLERLKQSSNTPPKGNKPKDKLTKEEFMKMSYQERVKLATENPDLYDELAK